MVTTLFTEEHDALRDTVRRWVERDTGPHVAAWEKAGGWPREVLTQVAHQGWLGAALWAQDGGDVIASLVVAEELGRLRSAGVVHDLLTHAHATAVVTAIGGEQWAAQAAALAQGEKTICGIGGAAMQLKPDGDGWRLNGSNRNVNNAAWADLALVVLPDDDGWSFALLDTSTSGWQAEAPSNPYGRRAARNGQVQCNNVRVDATQLVQGSAAAGVFDMMMNRWRLDHAAATISAAWTTWQEAREYALAREAFGRPIGTFQVNRHALADMAAELTAARSLVYDVAHKFLHGTLAAGETAAMRLYADEVTLAAADRCLQLHGGYGYTMEFDVQRAWRDAAHLRTDEGGHDNLTQEIASALEGASRA